MPHSLFKLSEKILNINNKNVKRTTEVQNLTAKLKGVSNVPCKIRSLVEYTDTYVIVKTTRMDLHVATFLG